jgi:hypothetical protein
LVNDRRRHVGSAPFIALIAVIANETAAVDFSVVDGIAAA